MRENILEATSFINEKIDESPEIGLILGSGLGVLGDEIEEAVSISYSEIPHFPTSTVSGHKGQLIIGQLEGKTVIAMQGRFHYYEGYSLQQVTFPVSVMKQLGIESIIVTNAAGGINENFSAGNLMIISDHINNLGENPLIGKNDETLGERFPDMSKAYDTDFIQHATECARELNLLVQKGIYAANSGPTYETPAEVRMLRTWGADAVGMSTVPEVIVARHAGLRVLGISCISNMAAGILNQPLTHTEVIETTERVREDFLRLVKKIIGTIPE
jgi:purine-nucleoside phosphorylase